MGKTDMIERRIVGRSEGILALRREVAAIAQLDAPVLIIGESGLNTKSIARLVHECSPRSDGPYVCASMAALPLDLMDSMLFGHQSGAPGHTPANPKGLLENAHGGTVFLDQIDDAPGRIQERLVEMMDHGSARLDSGSQEGRVDVRVVAATIKEIAILEEEASLSPDLLALFARGVLRVPPLRERREDIPDLIEVILPHVSLCLDRALSIESEAVEALQTYDFPDNIGELRAILETVAWLADDGAIRREGIVQYFGRTHRLV